MALEQRTHDVTATCPVCRFPFVAIELNRNGGTRLLRTHMLSAAPGLAGTVVCRHGHRFEALRPRATGGGDAWRLGRRLDIR